MHRLLLLCALGLLGAGCGCPPTPQDPVRLPDARPETDTAPKPEQGAVESAHSDKAPTVEPVEPVEGGKAVEVVEPRKPAPPP